MIKVIIANNNDILYNSLSQITLQYEGKVAVLNVTKDKLEKIICRNAPRESLIVLDSDTSVIFCNNILKYILNRMDKANVIILVIDSKTVTNIIGQTKQKTHNLFLKKKHTDLSTLDAINIVASSIRNTNEIEKNIDDILWKLGFASYFKGAIYLKDAILLAYMDNELLLDMNALVKKVAEKHNIENEKIVRSAMDKSLNNILDYLHTNVLYEVFKDDYDGRKVSVKYLIDLCIRYLEKQDIAV